MTVKEHFGLLKDSYKSGFVRFKIMLTDIYIRRFTMAVCFFGSLMLFFIFRYKESLNLIRFFYSGMMSSFILLILRDVYIMWFMDIGNKVKKKGFQDISFRNLFVVLMDSLKSNSSFKSFERFTYMYHRFMGKLNSFAFFQYLKKLDFWYGLWIFLFLYISL